VQYREGLDSSLDAQDYEAWYHTRRGRWIGDTEFDLLKRLLRPEMGESVLDVGCGTGYFTRRFAAESRVRIVGIDPNLGWLQFAGACDGTGASYCAGRAERLPFPDRGFDRTVSVTALCFVEDQERAVREIVRVTRKRFAIGLLNRHSILYLRKGRRGGSGAYRGARWHTERQIRALFDGLPVTSLEIDSAVLMPSGDWLAQRAEMMLPGQHRFGAFIVVAAAVSGPDLGPERGASFRPGNARDQRDRFDVLSGDDAAPRQ
jgi:SAM-dependent methyltransferase